MKLQFVRFLVLFLFPVALLVPSLEAQSVVAVETYTGTATPYRLWYDTGCWAKSSSMSRLCS